MVDGPTATKLKQVFQIISMEQQTSYAASSVTLGSAFTLPANTGDVLCYPSAACHWNPVGTATSTTGPSHAVAANEMFMILNRHLASAEIIGDSGAITLIIANMRGSRKLDHAVSRPY